MEVVHERNQLQALFPRAYRNVRTLVLLRGPTRILFISRGTCSDSITKVSRACFCVCVCVGGGGVSHDYRAICCKMWYRTDVPVQNQVPRGVSHHFGGVLTSLKKCRAIWGIAAIVSQYRAIWGLQVVLLEFTKRWDRNLKLSKGHKLTAFIAQSWLSRGFPQLASKAFQA